MSMKGMRRNGGITRNRGFLFVSFLGMTQVLFLPTSVPAVINQERINKRRKWSMSQSDKLVICTLNIICSVATRIMSFMINIELKLLKFNSNYEQDWIIF